MLSTAFGRHSEHKVHDKSDGTAWIDALLSRTNQRLQLGRGAQHIQELDHSLRTTSSDLECLVEKCDIIVLSCFVHITSFSRDDELTKNSDSRTM